MNGRDGSTAEIGCERTEPAHRARSEYPDIHRHFLINISVNWRAGGPAPSVAVRINIFPVQIRAPLCKLNYGSDHSAARKFSLPVKGFSYIIGSEKIHVGNRSGGPEMDGLQTHGDLTRLSASSREGGGGGGRTCCKRATFEVISEDDNLYFS